MHRPRRIIGLALSVVVLLAASIAHAGTPEWKWIGRMPQMNDLLDVTQGNGQFIAVGLDGTIITSPDGLRWTVQESGTTRPLRAVMSGKNLFVATGSQDGAGGIILTSPDGVSWTTRFTSEDAPISRVAYDGRRYVAVGWSIESDRLDGMILTSADGETWRHVQSPVQDRLVDVICAQGRFLATDGSHIIVSSDGEQWDVHNLPDDQGVYRMLYTGSGYVGLGARLTSPGFSERAVYRSSDGETWTPVDFLKPDDGIDYSSVAYTGENYVMLSTTSRSTGYILSATDGADWRIAYDSELALNGVACGPDACVAVGSFGIILNSTTGTDWKPVGTLPRRDGGKIVYGAGRFVMSRRTATRISPDGVDWTTVSGPEPYSYLGPMIYTGSQFVAITHPNLGGSLYTSPDGVTWVRKYEYPGIAFLDGLAYGNGRYVVTFGNAGWTISSDDLVTWTYSTNLRSAISAISFGHGKFVATTYDGTVVTSADGITWTQVSVGADVPSLTDIAYGDGRFIAAGYGGGHGAPGVILTSTDGDTWTLRELEAGVRVEHIAYGNGVYVAWGSSELLTSSDGLTWSKTRNRAGAALSGVAYGAGRFVGVAGAEPVYMADLCGFVFPDVPAGMPGCEAVEGLAARNVLSGFPDGNFQPEQTLTRAELTKLLVLALGKTPDPALVTHFSDTADHWVSTQGFLQTAVALDAISGFPDGSFQPDVPVTRAQMLKVVAAAAGLAPGGIAPYQDIQADDWFTGWVAAAHQAALIGPQAEYPLWADSTFRGDQPVTRAEAAMLLSNLADGKIAPESP